jgi:hypothetical protein
MNILPDTRDLINLKERGQPVSPNELREYLVRCHHKAILTFNNIRELAGPLAVNGDFLRIRRLLQAVEALPHRYIGEVAIPGLELRSAVEAFTSGAEYRDVSSYVIRWDHAIMARPGQMNPEYGLMRSFTTVPLPTSRVCSAKRVEAKCRCTAPTRSGIASCQ